MPATMQAAMSPVPPKHLRRIAAWLLLGWLLALGVAIAAPLMASAPESDICSARKATPAASRHGQLDCAQCLPMDAPPPGPLSPVPAHHVDTSPHPASADAQTVAPTAWQPPPRGPPRF